MTDQVAELIVPVEAEEVDEAQPSTRALPAQPTKPSGERLREVRMEINSMLPKPIAQRSKIAFVALALGLLVFWSLGLTAVPAIITGHIALLRTREHGRGRWFAIIGLVLGYATVTVFTLLILGGLLYMLNS